MLKIDKLNVKLIEFEPTKGESILKIKISGNNINFVIINTLRRTILTDIPIYAFTDFVFNKNTSVFHNNYIKERLNNLPVWGIENNKILYDDENVNEKFENNSEDEENDDIEDNIDVSKDNINNVNSSLKDLTLYLNYKNKTNNVVTVTTDHAKFYYDQKLIISPYPNPIPLVKLQENQEISFSVKSNLGIEKQSAIFNSSCCHYKEINSNEFEFTIESRGQKTELSILLVAISNIKNKLEKFKKLIKNNDINEDNLEGIITINNEDHTLGNLISKGLQLHDEISFSGYNLQHELMKIINIHYKLKNETGIKKIILDVYDYYINIFNMLNELFLELPT